MLKRIPILPTLLVLIAVGIMVRTGFWQLDRLAQKEALLIKYHSNLAAPALDAVPNSGKEFLFRRAKIKCENPSGITAEGAGGAGSRFIAACQPGPRVQLGTARNPRTVVQWPGGEVQGWIKLEPEHRSWVAVLLNPGPEKLMLVADPPLAGLAANAPPDPANIANNHLSYAVQWFLFAATALVIYALALRKRLAGDGADR